MAGFGAKVQLTVDKSGKKNFNDQINSMVSQVKISNKFTVLQKDMDRVRREAQAMLDKEQIILKVKRIDCSAAVKDVKDQLQAMLSSLSVSNGLNVTGLRDFLGANGADEAVNKMNQAKTAAAAWAGQMKVLDNIAKSLATTYRSGLSGKNMITDIGSLSEITTEYNAWQQMIEEIRSSQRALGADELSWLQNTGVELQRKITSLQNVQLEQTKAAEMAKRTAAEEEAAAQKAEAAAKKKAAAEEAAAKKAEEAAKKKAAAEEAAAKRTAESTERQNILLNKQSALLREQMTRYLGANTKLSSGFGNQIQSMIDELSSGASVSANRLKEIETEFSNIRKAALGAGQTGKSFFDAITNAYQRFGGWAIITRSMMAAVRSVKTMITNVRDLDAAMTELRKVTDATDKEYEAFFTQATVRAKDLGATVSDTINASADFARLGYTMDEAADLADAALVYKNVGDGIADIGEASESVISTMKAFNIEASDAMLIVDKFNEVGNNFAISSKGVGDALLRSASAMAAANNSLDETIALITTANSVVQDPEKVGTTLKTVSMFLRAAKTEAEEAGESTEGMANSVSELRDELLALTGGKVDIQVDENTFKSTYQIIKEISQVWNDLTDITQANILELLGGKRNSNVVAAMITNFDIAESVLETSANAAGSALAENEKYLDSINGKIVQFQGAFEALSATLINSEFVKGTVDFGTGIVESLTTIIESLGTIPTLASAAAASLTLFNAAKGNSSGLFGVSDQGEITLANNTITNFVANLKNAKQEGMDFSSAFRSAWSGMWTGVSKDINNYNGLLTTSGETQATFIKDIEISNSTLGSYFRTLNGGEASLAGYIAYCQQAGLSVNNLGLKSKLAAVGVTVLNTALNMLISMGVTLAIQAIVVGITNLINKQKEARQAAIDAGTEATEHAGKLYELASAYIELANAMDAGAGSRTEFISLQDQLIDFLGLEGNAVNELTNQYGSLREAIIAAASQQLQTDISLSAAGANAAKDSAIKELTGPHGGAGSYINSIKDGAKEALEYLESLGFSGIDNSGTKGGTLFLPNSTIDDLSLDVSFEQLLENYNYIERAMNEVTKKFGADNPIAKGLSDLYNTYHESISEAIDLIDNTNQAIAQEAVWSAQAMSDPTTQVEFEEFRKKIIDNVENSMNFDDAQGRFSAEDLVDSVLEQNTAYSEFLSALNERENTANEIRSKMQIITEALTPKYVAEQITESPDQVFDPINTWSEKAAEVKDRLRDLSEEELDVAFNAVENGATSWEEITKALAEYNEEQEIAQRRSTKLQENIRAIWSSENFKDTKEDLLEMAQTVSGITPDSIEKLASESAALSSILNEDGMNAQFLAHVLQSMADGGPGLSLITSDALELNAALDGMIGSFDRVTEAKSRYDSAMSVEEKDEDFKSYAEAFEELNKQFEAGTTNSNAFWAAAEFLFGSDQLASWGWSDGLDEIYAAMEKNIKVFSDADSAGAGFIQRLYEMSQAGEMVDDAGNKLLEISKDASGAFNFDIDPENIDQIAEKMGLTEEAVLACLQALSMWGDVNFYDIEEVTEAIEKCGLAAETAGNKALNITALTDQLISLGKTDKEINDIISDLMALDGVTLISAEGEIDDLITGLENLKLASSDGVTISVNTDGLSDLLSQINFTKDQAQNLIQKLGEADGITLTNAAGEVQDVAGALDYINTLDFASVTQSVDGVTSAVDEVDQSSTDNVVSELDDISSAADTATDKIKSISSEIKKLDGTKATVEVNVKRRSGILGFLGFAKGTKHAPGGESLLGEEGAELVQSGNEAYLAGVNGPEIVNLSAGDRVFTAEETKQIFTRSGKRISGTIPAYSGGYDGKASSSGLRVETDKKGEVGTPYKVVVEVDDKSVEAAKEIEETLEDQLSDLKEQLDKLLSSFEHKIFMLEKNGADSSEIVAIYRKMQEAVLEQEKKYNQLGLDENSNYIQELQKQWWEYEDSIRETIIESYEKLVREKENLIGKNDPLYDQALEVGDRASIERYAANVIKLYREMQETIHQEAEYYRSLGYSDLDDDLSKLGDLWWEYAEKIEEVKEKTVNDLLDMVNEVSDVLDEIQNAYDTLKDAANEYAENGGFISVDTFQKIIDLGPEYMQYLRDENDLLIINEESINRIIKAKTQQLALENAMSYVERLRLALAGESLEDLNTLLYATTEGTNATWGLVYANLALLNLSGEQYQAALHNINAIRALADNAISGVGKVSGTVSDELEEMKTGLDDILKYVMDMLEQRIENQIDALEDMKDAYADIIEMRKESLEAAKDESDYQDEVADKVKQIAKLQEQINALSLDDSRDAQAQKAALEEEMAELQKELADTQADYALDAQTDSLDKMQEAYEEEKDKEIEILEESISSYQKLYDMAIDYIKNNWDTLYGELIAWNTEYGDVLNSEITTAWENCLAAAQKYGSYVAALDKIDSDIESVNGSSGSGNNSFQGGDYDSSYTDEDAISAILTQMAANGRAYGTASPEKKQELADDSLRLGAQLAKYGIVAVRDTGGTWHVGSANGPLLFDVYGKYVKYHSGGVVGETPTVKQNEVLSLLEKGEVVLDQKKENGLYRIIDFIKTVEDKIGKAFGSFDFMNLFNGMQSDLETSHGRSLSSVNNSKVSNIQFGNVYIYGGTDDAVEKYRAVNREFTNEVLKQLNIKK